MEGSAWGEDSIIALMQSGSIVDAGSVVTGIGDDAAVLRSFRDGLLLATTDMLVEGQHFLPETMPLQAVGYKALAVNLSDIAAMGGLPRHALVAVALPRHYHRDPVERLFSGIKSLAREEGVNVVGGDTVVSPGPLFVSITLLGQVEEERVTLRSQARVGDAVLVTGQLGGSRAGLQYLLHPGLELEEQYAGEVLQKHQYPRPRVRESRLLGTVASLGAVNDISDGLAKDLREICRASQVGARIEAGRLPVSFATRQVAASLHENPLEYALYGGEDFELVITARPEAVPRLRQCADQQGFPLVPVGEIVPDRDGVFLVDGNQFCPLDSGGWDPFADGKGDP